MKRYKYVEVGGEHLTVKSTDEKIVEWVVTSAKKYVPTCSIDHNGYIGEAPERIINRSFSVHIYKLNNIDRELEWWIMEQLCQQGWEPFAVSAQGAAAHEIVRHFRLEISAEEK